MQYDHDGFVDAFDGTHLFYGIRGEREPTVVLTDGLGCEGFAWHYLQPHLAERHRVVHCHYRAHGRSGPACSEQNLGVQQLARDVKCVLDALKIRTATLFGHSLGTQVALEFYRENPSSVDAMVLICGTYGHILDTFHGTKILASMLPRLLSQTQKHPLVTRALWNSNPTKFAFEIACTSGEVDSSRIQHEDFRRYWEHISLMEPHIFLKMLQQASEHDAHDLLPKIEVPTLVLTAEHDTFTPMNLAQKMATDIPNAEFVLIKGGSHAAPVEQPLFIADIVEKFIKTHLLDEEPTLDTA